MAHPKRRGVGLSKGNGINLKKTLLVIGKERIFEFRICVSRGNIVCSLIFPDTAGEITQPSIRLVRGEMRSHSGKTMYSYKFYQQNSK